MKKIAVVLTSLNAGGAESRMIDILKVIDSSKYKIDFILLNKDNNQFYEREALENGSKIIKLSSPRKISLFGHLRELISTFKKGKYTAVHSNTSYHSGLVVLSAFFSGIKIRIVHARTSELRNRNIKRKVLEYIGKCLIRIFATDRLAISTECAKYLYGNKLNVRIVPNAINLERYSLVTNEDIINIKMNLNVPKTCKIIGHVGRFDDAKNQSFLIHVFQKLLAHNDNYILVLVGKGEKILECKELAQNLSIEKKIRFLGERKDIPVLMRIFDVFVFPSKYEGLGNVAIEAQAAGTPCVCSDSVPRSVDMEIGLVEFISLNNSLLEWVEVIEKLISITKVDFKTIQDCFLKRDYTLSKSLEILCSIYDRGKEYE